MLGAIACIDVATIYFRDKSKCWFMTDSLYVLVVDPQGLHEYRELMIWCRMYYLGLLNGPTLFAAGNNPRTQFLDA